MTINQKALSIFKIMLFFQCSIAFGQINWEKTRYFNLQYFKNINGLDSSINCHFYHHGYLDTLGCINRNNEKTGIWTVLFMNRYFSTIQYNYSTYNSNTEKEFDTILYADTDYLKKPTNYSDEFILKNGNFGYSSIFLSSDKNGILIYRVVNKMINGHVFCIYNGNFIEYLVINNKINGTAYFYDSTFRNYAQLEYKNGLLSGLSKIILTDTLKLTYHNGVYFGKKKILKQAKRTSLPLFPLQKSNFIIKKNKLKSDKSLKKNTLNLSAVYDILDVFSGIYGL